MLAPATARRLVVGGLPTVCAAAANAGVPILGVLYLSQNQYAVWALLSTFVTISLLFDFGAPTAAVTLAALNQFTSSACRYLCCVTCAPPLAIGAAVYLAWPYYASHLVSSGMDTSNVRPIIMLLTGAAIVRSVDGVLAGAALGHQNHLGRSVALVGSALVNIGVTWTALVEGAGLYTLVIGGLAAACVQWVLSQILIRERDAVVEDSQSSARDLVRRFIRAKGVASLCGLLVTQFDRWALALIAPAGIVGAYDLSVRLASLPKVALLAIGSGLAAEVHGLEDAKRAALFRTSLAITRWAAVVAAVIVFCLYLILQSHAFSGSGIVLLGALVIVVHGVHSTTTPSTLMLAGLGHPKYELTYLVPASLIGTASYALGIWSGSYMLAVTGWGLGLTITSFVFVARTPTFLQLAARSPNFRGLVS